jgi:hypothetical protein
MFKCDCFIACVYLRGYEGGPILSLAHQHQNSSRDYVLNHRQQLKYNNQEEFGRAKAVLSFGVSFKELS